MDGTLKKLLRDSKRKNKKQDTLQERPPSLEAQVLSIERLLDFSVSKETFPLFEVQGLDIVRKDNATYEEWDSLKSFVTALKLLPADRSTKKVFNVISKAVYDRDVVTSFEEIRTFLSDARRLEMKKRAKVNEGMGITLGVLAAVIPLCLTWFYIRFFSPYGSTIASVLVYLFTFVAILFPIARIRKGKGTLLHWMFLSLLYVSMPLVAYGFLQVESSPSYVYAITHKQGYQSFVLDETQTIVGYFDGAGEYIQPGKRQTFDIFHEHVVNVEMPRVVLSNKLHKERFVIYYQVDFDLLSSSQVGFPEFQKQIQKYDFEKLADDVLQSMHLDQEKFTVSYTLDEYRTGKVMPKIKLQQEQALQLKSKEYTKLVVNAVHAVKRPSWLTYSLHYDRSLMAK